jgi:hypothetical protein
VPLWLIKGDADIYSTYVGGQTTGSLGDHSNWWLPYEPLSNGNATTNPTDLTVIGLIWLRYDLSSSLTSSPSYFVSPYYNTSQNDNSTVSCKIYGGGTLKEVDDCIATNNGHIEPSIVVPESNFTYTNFGNQNQDIETATQEWIFFTHFTLQGYAP